MYVVTVNMPNLNKGKTVEIDGLGLFENGYEYQVGADEADAFRTKHVKQVASYKDDGTMVVETTEGPTLLQAFRKIKGIDVRKMDEEELKAFKQASDKESSTENEPGVNETPEQKEGDQ